MFQQLLESEPTSQLKQLLESKTTFMVCLSRGWRASWPAVHLSGRARRAAALLARRFARTGRPDRVGTSPCGGSNDPVPEKAVGATVVDRSIDLYSYRGEERALHGRYTFSRRCACTVQLSYCYRWFR